ncbi:hypothetical protein ACFPPF_00755 [Xenophilus aerolatus]|nr:hypothetical protein [Xenophilus aerolatus]
MRLRLTWAAWVTAVCLTACGGGDGSGSSMAVGMPSSADIKSADVASEGLASTAVAAKSGGEFALRPLALSSFSRENTYQFFSANGTEQVLRLDFQSRRFELLGASASVSGAFSEDASEPGTFVFTSPRDSGSNNTARFRQVGDTVIGAFPVRPAYASAQTLEVLPFIAARDFVTEGAAIDGYYAALETNRVSTGFGGGGLISTLITGAGTRMQTCMASGPYTLESCPNGLGRTYVLQQRGDLWHATSIATPSDQFDFRIALVNGEKIYVSGGVFRELVDLGGQARTGLRVGVAATSVEWPLTYGPGAVGNGRWGRYALDGAKLEAAFTDAGGNTGAITAAAWTPAGSFPSALPGVAVLGFGAGSTSGYAVQNRTVFLAWAAPPGTVPGLSIAQIAGTRSDSRNGQYTAFGLTGHRYRLQIDFDRGAYSLTDGGTQQSSGIVRRALQGAAAAGASEFVRTDSATAPTVSQFVVDAFAISGSLPTAAPGGAGSEPTPFVAARDFVTAQSGLSALSTLYAYTLSTSPSGFPLQMSSGMGFRQSGTVLLECVHLLYVPGTPLEACPADRLNSYSVSPGADAGTWRALASDDSFFDFQVARIGADLVFLQAANNVFRIGMGVAAPWRNIGALGVSQSYGPYDPSYIAIESALCTTATCSAAQFTSTSGQTLPWFVLSALTYDLAPAIRFSPADTTSYVHHQGRNTLIRHRGGNGRHLFVGFGQAF